jgi:APA family basic amino acid/polyamine antiporter
MLVMGGIVGSGIFTVPTVVARAAGTPSLVIAAWGIGGAIALAGAFVYAELAARFPEAGGQYVYLRETYHPLLAFLYGWGLLLVVQSGGMAAVAITFARYAPGAERASEQVVAIAALAALALVNGMGVRAGAALQSALMLLKIAAIGAVVVAGLAVGAALDGRAVQGAPVGALAALGAALTPVLFAYGGWQTAAFAAGEASNPARDLRRALLLGVSGVVGLYLAINAACLSVLGVGRLAESTAPASEVMQAWIGPRGAQLVAIGIAVSTLGFLAQSMLTAPRVYFAMARDGLFFAKVGELRGPASVPAAAILLQAAVASAIAWSGRFEQILSYVVAVDFLWFGLVGTAVLARGAKGRSRIPGHPWTTFFFIAACWIVSAATIVHHPVESGIGFAILASGVPIFFLWRARATRPVPR